MSDCTLPRIPTYCTRINADSVRVSDNESVGSAIMSGGIVRGAGGKDTKGERRRRIGKGRKGSLNEESWVHIGTASKVVVLFD